MKSVIMRRAVMAFAVTASASAPAAAVATSERPASAATPAIQHVVMIFQENHSFDETLGALCTETTPSRCDGYVGPVTLKGGTVVPMQVSPDKVPQAGHDGSSQTNAIDGGAMDGWAKVGHCTVKDHYQCVSYYRPDQIPNLAALARRYVVSDRTFSMARSASFGGHLYAVASSLDGFDGTNPRKDPDRSVTIQPGWGCDSNQLATWVNAQGTASKVPSCIPDTTLGLPNGGAYKPTPVPHIPTIMDRLDDAGKTWKLYVAPKGMGSDYAWSICPSFADCLYKHSDQMVPPSQILTDAHNGTLANYSVITPNGPGGGTSQHNVASMLNGDNWIGQMVSALQNGPEWSSTAVFITYDDCGCFYDHVVPGVNADGSSQGIRLPMVVASPYAKPGYTDSNPTSIVGVLSFTEHTFGLSPLNTIDANAYDYHNSFDFSQTPLPPVKMRVSPLPASSRNLPDADPDDPT